MSTDDFSSVFGTQPTTRARAPGRVNLIGEHTDYNDGFVLPMVIPQETTAELAPRNDELVRGYSAELAEGEGAGRIHTYRLAQEKKSGTWIDYIQGLTVALRDHHEKLRGFDLRVESQVPVGSGLSSSAALEISVLRALREAFALPLDDVTIAKLGRRAENDFVGAPVGIMDQMAASLGRPNTALFIDTRSLEYRLVELPKEAELVVIASGVQHAHGTGGYRIRRQECDEATRRLGVKKLRELDVDDLPKIDALPAPLSKRARHVVTENARVWAALEAFEKKDLARVGRLFVESHASMRDDFEISVPEIDLLVQLSLEQPGVYGARLTGGGFGGSIVVLAKKETGWDVASAVAEKYDAHTGLRARILLPALT